MAEFLAFGRRWNKRGYKRIHEEGLGGGRKRKLQMMRMGGGNSNRRKGIMWRLKTVVKFMRPFRPWAILAPLLSQANKKKALLEKSPSKMSMVQRLTRAVSVRSSRPSATSLEKFNASMLVEMYKSVGIHVNVDQVRTLARDLHMDLTAPRDLLAY